MAEHTFKTSLIIKCPRDEAFAFFSNAENLELITPPQLGFRILTPTPFTIQKGTLIDYQLSLYGIPVKWRTEITEWSPPAEFTDEQLKGPYKQWIHNHRFTEVDEFSTLMEDTVRYRLPLEPFGDLGVFMVKREIEGIFDYRQRIVSERLEGG